MCEARRVAVRRQSLHVTDFVIHAASDQAVIAGGDTRTIPFRPQRAGRITIRSTPEHPPTHSETGSLGRLDLRRPGRATPLATVKPHIGATVLAVSYEATDADLVPTGDWTCDVTNATEVDLTFDTVISYPSIVPLEKADATFDVGLLNLLLAETIADAELRLHVESSGSEDDPRTVVSWSPVVANLLPAPFKGQGSHAFFLADTRIEHNFDIIGTVTAAVVRVTGLDSDPDVPIRAVLSSSDQLPVVQVDLAFKTDTAQLAAIDSDLNLDVAQIKIQVHSFTVHAELAFDGTIRATCETSAKLVFPPGALVGELDISGLFKSKVDDALAGAASGVDRQSLRQAIDAFYIGLMRLGSESTVRAYTIAGETLTVSYVYPGGVHLVVVGHPTTAVEPH